MKVLVFGAKGQLGQALMESAPMAGHDAIGLSRVRVDITDTHAVSDAIRTHEPDAVINTAAFIAGDAAEDDRDVAFRMNADWIRKFVSVFGSMCVPLRYNSSDYVFDSSSHIPCLEDDPNTTTSVYEASKAEGETGVRNATWRHLFVRSSWIFGQSGNKFVKAILAQSVATELIRVVDHQFGFPTAAYRHRALRHAYSALDCQRIITKLGINVPAWPAVQANIVDHWVAKGI